MKDRKDKKIIIAVVGMSSSGKDTVAEYLEKKGFAHISLSDILREIGRKRNIYRSRADLIKLGNELRKRYGPSYLARQGLKKAAKLKTSGVVFSSVRSPYEIKELKKSKNTVVLAITVPLKVRFERLRKRGKIDDNVTFSQFKAQEEFERKGPKHQQQLDKVVKMADYQITNNSTLKRLYKGVERVLEQAQSRFGYNIMNIVMLGPQGSGKGTQAEVLAKKYNLSIIGTGAILRKLARRSTPLGKQVNKIINQKGQLIPAKFVIRVVKHAISMSPKNKGLLFDGFPRNLTQAKALDQTLEANNRELTRVIYLPVSKKTTIKRLSLRRCCVKCGRIFIKGVNIGSQILKCPRCQGKIIQRKDDKPKAIARRLSEYNKKTKPVISYYQKRGILIRVDGEPAIPRVTKELFKKLT